MRATHAPCVCVADIEPHGEGFARAGGLAHVAAGWGVQGVMTMMTIVINTSIVVGVVHQSTCEPGAVHQLAGRDEEVYLV